MYLGNIPATSFEAVKKDRFTGLTGTGVTLSHSVSNVQDVVVWVNSVKQDYNNYSVSGTSLTLGGSLVSTDVVQVLYVGRTFQTVNPSADSVTASQIADNAISEEHLDPTIITGLTALASEPDDTDEFLVSDAGTLKRIDYSLIKGGGITMADAFRLSADTNSGSNADVTSNWERVDDPSFGGIGTGLTESSGIFSFPSTGIYLITWQAIFYVDAGDIVAELTFKTTNDNSSYNDDGYVYIGNGSGSNAYGTGASSNIFDVTDISNDKFKFRTGSMGGSTVLKGYTTSTQTGFSVIRLGDT